jgi:hypothetical protein
MPSVAQQQGGPTEDQTETRQDGLQAIPRSEIQQTRRGRLEYIVSVRPRSVAPVRQALEANGATLLRQRPLRALNRVLLTYDFNNILRLPQARGLIPRIPVDAHALYRYAGQPRLYAAALIGDASAGGCRVPARQKIGLIDGPVNRNHPSLARARITMFSAYVTGDRPTGASHGTSVAGLLVGEDGSGALAGFAPGATLCASSAFAKAKGGDAANVDRIGGSLDWLVGQGVRLVNMSFAGPQNQALTDLLSAASERGTVMVAAAGNRQKGQLDWPAASKNTISVTAVDASGRAWRRANKGAEFAAPGVDLFVAEGRAGSGYASGTSFAAPIVTALAARRGGGSANAVRANLKARAQDLGRAGFDATFGWGLVRAGGC